MKSVKSRFPGVEPGEAHQQMFMYGLGIGSHTIVF